MGFKIKAAVYLVCMALLGYVGWRGYCYAFDQSAPTITLTGIRQDHHYKGDVQATLSGHDAYKVDTVSVFVDDEPIVAHQHIGSSSFELPFTVQTNNLAHGPHHLKIEAVDGTYHQNKASLDCTFYVDNIPLHIAITKPVGDVRIYQGKTIHLQFQLNKPITKATAALFMQEYECFLASKSSQVWECYIPVACEQDIGDYTLELTVEDAVGSKVQEELPLQVVAFPFTHSTLRVDQEKMEKELEMSRSQQDLEDRIEALVPKSPHKKLWHGPFYPPIEIQRKTTDYGTIRTTQMRGRYMHKAVDVINTPKSVVWAPQDGIVILKDRFAYSGNTVVIDHGFGIFTLLFHLDEFADINVGDRIRRGNPVGTLGKTGYAKGYHLHWEMRINNTHVDPEQWIDPNF